MGNSCNNCDPCPPCETQFPVLCEALPSTTQALSFVVEDSAFCKTVITGETGQIPRIGDDGFISFANATSASTPNTIVSRDSLGGADFGELDATGLNVNNPSGDTKIEIGGTGNVYVDLKNPQTDDYDLRLEATANDQKIYTNSSKLLIDASVIGLQSVTNQDVGIGTNAPIAKLDIVENQIGQTAVRINNANTSTAASAGVLAQQGGVAAEFIASGNAQLSVGTTTNHPINLKTNNVDRVNVSTTGNVGIGTSNPLNLLHINSNADTFFRMSSSAGANWIVGTNTTGYVLQNVSASPMFFGTNNTTRAMIGGNGDIGINTLAPAYKVDINADANSLQGIRVRNPNAGSSANTIVQIGNDANGAAAAIILNSSANTIGPAGANALSIINGLNAPLTFWTNNTQRVTILAGGDVGIGVTNPSHRLQVAGGIRSTSDVNGIGYATGAGGAATVTGSGTGQTVTINKICGTITCQGPVAGSTTRKAVVVTNSTVGEFDTVIISGKGGANAYEATVFNVKTGEFSFQYSSPTGTANETPVFNFSVIKSVNA